MRRITIFLMVIFIAGCTPFGGFKPDPFSWTYYLSGGAGEAQIRAAMLECGSNVPGDFREFSAPGGNGFLLPLQRLNELVLVEKCMQNAGFLFTGDQGVCSRWKDLPACQPNAVIPVRSVQNRVGSPFCKLLPQAAICQPNYDPRAPQVKAPT